MGKSTTAVSLGAALAERGSRVLVVDLDPQGNASTGLGIRHEARDITVYDVLAAEAPIESAIVQTPVERLFAIPSTIDLAGAEIELVSQFSRELRLRKALEPLVQGHFDFIFLDCPPSLGLLTVNALAAAEELLVPIQCEYYALEGLGQLLRNVRLVQQNVNPELRLTGIVMTMFDPRTKLSQQVVDEVRRFFGDRVYETVIPRTVRLSEAPGFGQPITVYDPKSRGAECYRELAREVAERVVVGDPMPVFDTQPQAVARLHPQEPRAPYAPPSGIVEIPDSLGEPEAEPEVETSEPYEAEPEVATFELHETEPEVETSEPYEVEVAVADAGSEPEREPEGEDSEEAFDPRPVESAFAEVARGDPVVDAEAWLEALEAEAKVETDASTEEDRQLVAEVTVPETRSEAGGTLTDTQRKMVEAETEPATPEHKKRWSLFRKGGAG